MPDATVTALLVAALGASLIALLVVGGVHTRQDDRRRLLGTDWQDLALLFATDARRAGLPHIGGPHGLRHSLASSLGWSIRVRPQLMASRTDPHEDSDRDDA